MDASIAHRRILLLEQLLRLCRPRHQLAIEAEPVGSQFIPETRLIDGYLKTDEELALQLVIREEATAGAGIDGSHRSLHYSEALLPHPLVFTHHTHTTPTHLLLLQDNHL